MEFDRIVEALRSPAAYPWSVGSVDYVETHISSVFLAGDKVLKLKRPVCFPFVDFSSPALRRRACEREAVLNRRLSDDVYLGVASIVPDGTGVRVEVGARDDALEQATLMRRLDPADMLDARLSPGASPPADLARSLAARLVPFHRDAAPPCVADPTDPTSPVLRIPTENLDELRRFAGTPLSGYLMGRIDDVLRGFPTEHPSLFAGRAVDGWVREGHGDLRCEHICMPDGSPLQVIDCVEFNADLRCADIASDLAFLLMDLHHRGAPPAVIRELVRAYEESGIPLPVGLLRYYWVHRALVRAKVHCLQLGHPDPQRRAVSSAKAGHYVAVAAAQVCTAAPMVVVMMGFSGAGKSTMAGDLAMALSADRIATDAVRAALAEGSAPMAAGWGEGAYASGWDDRVYGRLFGLARERLAAGRPVVLDGTFLHPSRRAQAAALARERGVPLLVVHVTCDETVVLRRLADRAEHGGVDSYATADTYRRQRAMASSPETGLPPDLLLVEVDTSAEAPADIGAPIARLEAAGLVTFGIRGTGDLVT